MLMTFSSWRKVVSVVGASLSVYIVLCQLVFNSRLDVPFAYNSLAIEGDHNPYTLKLDVTGMDATILTYLDDDLLSPPALPSACSPALLNGTFDEDFANHVKDLPLLTYAGSLLGRHSVRAWFTAGLASELDASTANQIVPRARMTPGSQKRFCSARHHFHPDHTPHECDPSSDQNYGHPPYSWPWCFPPTDPVHIMSIDCGIVDNYFSHPDVTFTLFSDQAVISTDRGRWKVQSGVPVTEFQELAIMGAAEYATEPGMTRF